MKYRNIVLLIIVTFLGFGTAQSDSGDPTKGASQWAANCARCHNMRDPTEFEARLWRPIVTHMRVRAGLTGEDARNILSFLQSAAADSNRYSFIKPKDSDTAEITSIRSGQSVYETTCVACHGTDGSGAIPGTPDFTTAGNPLITKSEEKLLKNMIEGFQSEKSLMAMPAKGGNPNLTDEEMRKVLEYMLSEFRK